MDEDKNLIHVLFAAVVFAGGQRTDVPMAFFADKDLADRKAGEMQALMQDIRKGGKIVLASPNGGVGKVAMSVAEYLNMLGIVNLGISMNSGPVQGLVEVPNPGRIILAR